MRLASRSRCFAAALSAAFVLGCARPHSAREAFVPEVVAADQAAVYVYRPARAWAGSAIRIFIDQEFAGELDAGEYLSIALPPGERLIRVEGASSTACRVEPGAGEAVYLEVQSSRWNPRPTLENVGFVKGRPAIGATRRAR